MFRPHGYFRGISCPNQSDCTLPNCFFSHDLPPRPRPSPANDATTTLTTTTTTTTTNTTTKGSYNADPRSEQSNIGVDEQQPSKRRKLDANANANAERSNVGGVSREARGHKRESSATATGTNDDFRGGKDGNNGGDWTVVGRDTKRSRTRKEDGGPVTTTTTIPTTTAAAAAAAAPKPPLKSILKKPTADAEGGGGLNGATKTATPKATTGSSLKALRTEISKPTLPLRSTAPAMKKKPPPPASSGGNKFAALASANDDDAADSASSSTVKKESLNPRSVPHAPTTHVMRQTLLNYVFEELSRLNPDLAKTESGRQVITKAALDEEEETARENLKTYGMVMRNRYMALKKMTVEKYQSDDNQSLTKKHNAAKAAVGSAAKKPETEGKKEGDDEEGREINTGLTPDAEVAALRGYTHTNEELTAYNYVMAAPSEQEVEVAKDALRAAAGYEECDRCRSRFRVYPGRNEEDGSLASGGECTYHWGKAFPQRRAPGSTLDMGKIWECCNQPIGDTAGCSTAESHVFVVKSRNRLATVWQFAETTGDGTKEFEFDSNVITDDTLPANHNHEGGSGKVEAICLDCEMCYTTNGLELCRVTATKFPGHEHVLDVLVRPFGEILDLNTRFSGVTKAQYTNAKPFTRADISTSLSNGATGTSNKDVKSDKNGNGKTTKPDAGLEILPSPSAARDVLLSLITPATVIVGHALDNDLNSLRLIHPAIVDTAILFPHRRGLPLRNSLKWLVRTHLKRQIQTQGVDGHDSREDADSAGDLVRWRMVQDVKLKNIDSDGKWTEKKKKNKRK